MGRTEHFTADQLRRHVTIYDFNGIVLTHATARGNDKCASLLAPWPAVAACRVGSDADAEGGFAFARFPLRSWEVRWRCKMRLHAQIRGRGPATVHRIVDSVNSSSINREARRGGDDHWHLRPEVLATKQDW